MDEKSPPDDRTDVSGPEDETLDSPGVAPAPASDLAPPEITGYRTIRLLGQGGMGRVYLAEDEFLDRRVAIKVISEVLPREEAVVAQFQREARAMAAIEHPNIVHVYAFGIASGRPYFVMQYIDGESLAERIERTARLPFNDASRFLAQVVDALDAAWQQRIVHRDLKPANILIDRENNAHVADFGLARAVMAAPGAGGTPTGRIQGTPKYLAPEQARGDEVDFRADFYSLGLVAYEMLAGEAPFEGDTPLLLMAKRLQEPLPPIRLKRPDLPVEVERIIQWLTAKDPDLRPETHEALRRRVQELASVRPSTDRGPVRRPPVHKPPSGDFSSTSAPVGRSSEALEQPPPAQQKQATVLRAEITGTDRLRAELDSAAFATTMSEVRRVLTETVERSGGALDEIRDQRLTAAFGYPTAFEGSPVEAVNAGITMRREIESLGSRLALSVKLGLRIGIETGPVIGGAADVGSDARFAMGGSAVESAEALSGAASAGQIYVGRVTHRFTSDLFKYRGTSSARPSLKTSQVDAFELLSLDRSGRRPLVDRGRLRPTDLIGRGQELDRLGLRVLELLNGKGSIVSIVGPAGIGKSRLLSELRRAYTGRNVVFLEGRAIAIGETLSFHPIIDILKRWANISDHDANAEAIHKLETAIAAIDPEHALETFPFIATLMGLKLAGKPAERVRGIAGDKVRQLIFKNLRDLIVAASRTQPLVFVLEDLHWADQTSIEFLESLYGLVMNHQILFINLFRPGHTQTSGRVSSMLEETLGPYYEEVRLQPLTVDDCERLVVDLLGASDLPAPVKESIIAKTDGNPFFIEEVTRSMLDEGVVRLERGKLRMAESLESVDVPETVQDVLLARIDRLDDETRTVIRIASVIGRTFLHRVVAEVGQDIDQLDERLQYLEYLGMIQRIERFGELAYTFRHALMQEVAYGSILAPQRRDLHLQIARSMERLFAERESEFYGMLAFHYVAAEDSEKSEEYLIKAGGEALRSAASSEALRFFRHALKLYSSRRGVEVDPETVANLEKNVALALFSHGNYGEAIECFRKVLPAFGVRAPEGDLSLAARFLVCFLEFVVAVHLPRLWFWREPTPKDSEGIRLYYQELSALAQYQPKRFFLESFLLARRLSKFDLTKVENGVGMFASAGNLLSWTGVSFYLSSKVLRLLEETVDDADPRAAISYGAAQVTHAFLAGQWDTAPFDDALVKLALDLGETFLASNYVIFHGRLALEQGRLHDARTLAAKLEDIGVEYDHLYPPALHVYLHAKILLKKRRLRDAVNECDEGRRVAEKAALATVLYGLGSLKARAVAYMGDIDGAERELRAVEASSDGSELPKSYRGDFLISRCTVDVMGLERAVRQGDVAEARRLQHRAARSSRRLLANSAKVASHRVEAAKLAGLVDWFGGRRRQAFRHWERGVQIGEQLGAHLDLSRLYAEIGKRLQTASDGAGRPVGASAREYIDRARTMFDAMELEWDIAELESAVGH